MTLSPDSAVSKQDKNKPLIDRFLHFRTGGNEQFTMMSDQFFVYDSSIIAPLARVPVWPYTLHYRFRLINIEKTCTTTELHLLVGLFFIRRMPHKCHGNSGNCPSRSHPVWEMPINELDRRDDPEFDEVLTGCHLVSSCSNIYYKEQFRLMSLSIRSGRDL